MEPRRKLLGDGFGGKACLPVASLADMLLGKGTHDTDKIMSFFELLLWLRILGWQKIDISFRGHIFRGE